MTWNHFPYFALVAVLLWAVGAYAAWKDKKALTLGATVAGLLVFFGFIVAMWVSLERPPLRTMGETRLWYSFFLPFAGMVVYLRWHYKSVCTPRSLNGDILRTYFGQTLNAYKAFVQPMSYFLIYTRVRDKSKSVCKLPHSTSWRDNHFFTCPVLFSGHGILSRMC